MRKIIDQMLAWILIGLMAVLVIDVLWQVASRYVWSVPSSFTDEVAGFLLVWVGLLGAAYVAGSNGHLAIDLLLQRTSNESKRRQIQLFIQVMIVLFALSVLVIGGAWLVYTRLYLDVTSASLQINLGYVYSVLPISGLLTCYYAIDTIIQIVRRK